MIYVIYCLLVFFVEPGNFFNDDVKDAVLLYIAIPLIVYLLLPFVLKVTGNWKIVRWLDDAIDYIYKTIKEPDKQHEFQKGAHRGLAPLRLSMLLDNKKE